MNREINQLKLLIKTDYLTDIKSKSFWIGTFLAPVLIIAFGAVIGFLASDSDAMQEVASATGGNKDLTGPQVAGMLVGMILTMFLMMFGAQVYSKVRKEKVNRIMEVLATCVTGRQMMLAKVISVALIGLTQLFFWMVLIFRFSAETGIESHEISDQVTLLFCKVVHRFTGRDLVMSLTAHQYAVLELCFRKMAHMGIYCMLSFSTMLVLFTFPLGMVFRMLASLIFCVVYACSDEFHQLLVEGRSPRALDVMIDSAGAVTGIIAALLFFCVVFGGVRQVIYTVIRRF